MASFSSEHEAPAEFRPGLHLRRQSSKLLLHFVFLRCATMVLTIGSTARKTFFAVETACTTPSITFNTSQPWCFRFVFLRFIFSSKFLLCWHGAVFPHVSSLFLPFPCGANPMGNS